jgi:hypothetical protein
MTREDEELVKRLGYHHEHPVISGKMVLINPDGPEAAARLTTLAEERDALRKALERITDDMAFVVNHAALYGSYDRMKQSCELARAALQPESSK